MIVNTDATEQVADQLETLLQQMTLDEKIGQMTQVEKNSITPEEVATYAIGSVLSGGGGNPAPNSPENWARMVHGFLEGALQSRLGIPLIYGVDAIHGHNNVVGATIFPHNIGLGATRNPALVDRIGRVTAQELIATNVRWDFAPCVAVPQDIRWGRTYEGYSEDTALVTSLGAAYVRGLQSDRLQMDGGRELGRSHAVLACPKHFVGDGGTRWGSTGMYTRTDGLWQSEGERWSVDQGVTDVDEQTLREVHLPPYAAAISAGAQNIMVSFSSWGGKKMHAHRYLLMDVLKGELGFEGFLVSDWMAINQIDRDYYQCVVTTINAGLDMVMVPFEFRKFIETLREAVLNGDVGQERIDDAVRRILHVKAALGLFEHPFGDESLLEVFGGQTHRAVAREAVRESLVLLKNEGDVLPLANNMSCLLVAGRAADDIGLQCGGWTIEWMGKCGDITPGTTFLQGVQAAVSAQTEILYSAEGSFDNDVRAPVGIVVLAEPPYAEGEGDRSELHLPESDLMLLQRVRQHCERLVVVLFSGRPLIITEQLPQWDAFVAAWLPGSEGQGISDVLFGDYPFSGKLPYTWPRNMAQIPCSSLRESDEPPLFAYGFGLV